MLQFMAGPPSCEPFAAVDLERDAGQEGVGQHEHRGLGDVVGCADAPGRVAFARPGEQLGLAFVAERVPGAGIDDAG
jgi:hypothetical protein